MKPYALTAIGLGTVAGISLVALAATPSLRAPGGRERPSDPCAARLATFDTLDYDVFSHQQWNRLSESHASDITVTWPDGHETHGIARHIEDLKGLFAYAPSTNIAEHPIRICSGDYTAVTGVMTGAFSQPMATGDGKTIPPTGKAYRITMVTIGHWTGSTMDHEWLFWDNHEFMRQIGLAP